jgi:hypothetical protein
VFSYAFHVAICKSHPLIQDCASLNTPMKIFVRLILPLVALCFVAAAKKPEVSVRFHSEANRLDGERFASPIQLKNPPRETFIQRVPTISERQIKAIFPFQAPDGTWGCSFMLDHSGRLNLEVLSTERRGSSFVAFVGTKKGTHQVIDMQIDKVITDGIITIQYGLTELEVAALQKAFPTLGQASKKS